MGIAIILVIYNLLKTSINNVILTLFTIIIGAVIYVLAIVYVKVLEKDEILSLPMGDKAYKILKKLKIYA